MRSPRDLQRPSAATIRLRLMAARDSDSKGFHYQKTAKALTTRRQQRLSLPEDRILARLCKVVDGQREKDHHLLRAVEVSGVG